MYTSVPYTYVTTASTNLRPVSGASETAKLAGYFISNNAPAAAGVVVKLYWSRQGEVPVVGTTVPDVTIAVAGGTAPLSGFATATYSNPVGRMGQLYMWVTALQAASDTTATAAGDGIITLLLQY